MSTIEKDLKQEEKVVSGGTCGLDKKPNDSNETTKTEEGEKKAKSGGCGC
jgi:hypothetical protein